MELSAAESLIIEGCAQRGEAVKLRSFCRTQITAVWSIETNVSLVLWEHRPALFQSCPAHTIHNQAEFDDGGNLVYLMQSNTENGQDSVPKGLKLGNSNLDHHRDHERITQKIICLFGRAKKRSCYDVIPLKHSKRGFF